MGSYVLQRLIYGTLEIFLSETTEPRVYIWHVASSSRLTKFAENYGPVAQNEASSGIKVLYIAYIENILKHILVRYKKA